jgi:N-methylhydantoinase A
VKRNIKIGIDVGGTFTHAVAIDINGHELIAKTCVPTTHTAREGVAKGVVGSMDLLLKNHNICADEIILIAHSTTQATNALLEGDVAVVGIIGMGKGLEGIRAKKEINLKNIQLSPGKFLQTRFRFLDISTPPDKLTIKKLIDELCNEGAQVIVSSEAFGVDDPSNEDLVAAAAEEMGLQATAASRISRLYGLRVRTRTAVINASMMPKMLETANMTELAIRKSGVSAPLMVMRSDGGIMDINEMRKRPILTMLSGPAAGIAAALLYEKVSDAVFLEVGGTSTDISVIKNGKPQLKSAQIGGNRLYLKTLDVRTLGIAGGSIPRVQGNKIVEVGPRSAHIAGLNYVSYSDEDFSDIEIEKIQPLKNDPDDYISIKLNNNTDQRFTITPTGAANFLGLVKEHGHGAANMSSVVKCFESLSSIMQKDAKEIAEEILRISAEKIKSVISQLSREYKLDKELIQLVGGGGGASALVPFTAMTLDYPHKIARDSEVISAIGAALGMIKDTVEKTVINPTENDIISLRQQAFDSVAAMGAVTESIEVSVEIDSKNKKIVAVAMGSSDMRTDNTDKYQPDIEDIKKLAAVSLRTTPDKVNISAENGFFYVSTYKHVRKLLFGWIKDENQKVRIIDRTGTIRLQLNSAFCEETSVASVRTKIKEMIEKLTSFGDAGALIPDIYLLAASRIIDLTGLINETQIAALVDFELSKVPKDEKIIVIAAQKK